MRKSKIIIQHLKRRVKHKILLNKQYKNDADILEDGSIYKSILIQRHGLYQKRYNHEF